jgi:hypothetical protein
MGKAKRAIAVLEKTTDVERESVRRLVHLRFESMGARDRRAVSGIPFQYLRKHLGRLAVREPLIAEGPKKRVHKRFCAERDSLEKRKGVLEVTIVSTPLLSFRARFRKTAVALLFYCRNRKTFLFHPNMQKNF